MGHKNGNNNNNNNKPAANKIVKYGGTWKQSATELILIGRRITAV